MINKSFNFLKNNKIQFGIILIVSFILLFGVRKNYLENNLNTYHDDEYHTVYLGIKSFQTGEVENFRSLEGARWMYRLFYPGALIKMSQNMGGNTVISGWENTGHNYILNEYINKDPAPANVKQRLVDNPNLRDFFYYLRVQNLLFVFICFIPLLYYCFKHKYYLALVFLMVFPAFNIQLTNEQSYAYIEPMLMGFISLSIWLFLYLYEKRKVSIFMMIFLGFFSAFIISVKFSSLFFVLLLLTLPFYNKDEGINLEAILKKGIIIIGTFILFFIVINYYGFFGNFNVMLHDFVSNFWNYQNGQSALASDGSTAGFYNNFKNIVSEFKDLLGYFIYLLPIIWAFGFKYADKNERFKFGLITIALSLSLFSLMKQVEFYERNVVPFYIPFLFISGAFSSIIIRKFQDKIVIKNIKVLNYLFIAIVLIAYIGVFNNNKNIVTPDTINNFQTAINNIPDLEKRNIKFININEDILDKYSNSKTDISTDIYYTQINYKEKLKAIIDKFNYNDIILVDRNKKNYNQYSNFLLPRYFNTNQQFGSYFLFYNKELKAEKAEVQNLNDTPIIISDQIKIENIELAKLDVDSYELSLVFDDFFNESLIKNGQVYFYFHAYSYPEDSKSLPVERVQYGFDNFDILDMNLTKEFGKPSIKKTFTSKLKQYESFRLGLVDVTNGNVIKHFQINNVKL